MSHRLVAAVLFVVSVALLHAPRVSAQTFDSRVSFRLGMNGPSVSGDSPLYSEIELENGLYTLENMMTSLKGSVFAGYWKAGDGNLFRCDNPDTFCKRNFAMGTRLRVKSERDLLPISVFAGVSYHVVDEERNEARFPVDTRFNYVGAGGGVRLDIPFAMNMHFVVQMQAHLPLTEREVGGRHALTLGVSAPF